MFSIRESDINLKNEALWWHTDTYKCMNCCWNNNCQFQNKR